MDNSYYTPDWEAQLKTLEKIIRQEIAECTYLYQYDPKAPTVGDSSWYGFVFTQSRHKPFDWAVVRKKLRLRLRGLFEVLNEKNPPLKTMEYLEAKQYKSDHSKGKIGFAVATPWGLPLKVRSIFDEDMEQQRVSIGCPVAELS